MRYIVLPLLVFIGISCDLQEKRKDTISSRKEVPSEMPAQAVKTYDLDGLVYDRAYYAVISEDEGLNCAIVPRPDYTTTALKECDPKDTSEFSDNLRKYGFCVDPTNPMVINKLPCDFAIEAAVFLNNGLKFTAKGPYPYAEDVKAACTSDLCKNDKVVKPYCEFHTRCEGQEACPAIGRLDTEDEKSKIAKCLNAVYGIK